MVFPSLLLLFPSQTARRLGRRAPSCAKTKACGPLPLGGFDATAAVNPGPTGFVALRRAPSLMALLPEERISSGGPARADPADIETIAKGRASG